MQRFEPQQAAMEVNSSKNNSSTREKLEHQGTPTIATPEPLETPLQRSCKNRDASESRDVSIDRNKSWDPKILKGSNYIVHRQTAESKEHHGQQHQQGR
jgi:hypothetical protein